MFLHPDQVIETIKQAEREDEVVVVRCVRKGKASKVGGPDSGELYDLHCTKKPPYKSRGGQNREAEDSKNGVLTVFASNRRDSKGKLGDWRRVNIQQVQKVIYKGIEYEVVTH